jgi:hypothetical protein
MAEGIREAFAKSIESGLVDIEEESMPRMAMRPDGTPYYKETAPAPPDRDCRQPSTRHNA